MASATFGSPLFMRGMKEAGWRYFQELVRRDRIKAVSDGWDGGWEDEDDRDEWALDRADWIEAHRG